MQRKTSKEECTKKKKKTPYNTNQNKVVSEECFRVENIIKNKDHLIITKGSFNEKHI